MNYIFEIENKNYEDFASGRVMYNRPGTTSFPARLASEIFQRCEHILSRAGASGPYSVYDPCCGGAYLLSTIGFMHGDRISKIFASDIDESVVALAQRNLSLLSLPGIEQRTNQIRGMIADFGKESHIEALQSAANLKESLLTKKIQISTMSFIADATKKICTDEKIDIVITDLPYGKVAQWSDVKDEDSAIKGMLDNLIPSFSRNSIVAIVSSKKTLLKHGQYKRVEQFHIGKRKVTFLQCAV